jgi:2,3-bisphosphoglycerate-dependent phosphoglycerate mutase
MEGHTPLVSGHGNTFRGIVKHLDKISDDDIPNLEIPTGRPLIYDLDEKLRPIRSRYLDSESLGQFQ